MSAPSPRAAHSAALLQNLGAIVAWSIAPSMIHAVSAIFPVNLQNACRYLASLVVLWPVLLLTLDRSSLRASLRLLRDNALRIVAVAMVNYAFQLCYTESLALVTPSVMSLVYQTQVLFGVLLGAIFFADERAFIKSPLFLTGLALALGGVAMVIVGGHGFGTPAFGLGVLVVVAAAFCWSLLGVLLKKWLPQVPPLLSLAAVYTIVTPLFVATYAFTHKGGFPIPHASALPWVLLIGSGLIGVGLGQSLYYRAVPVLGVSITSSLSLLMPLLASAISFAAFGEWLTPLQIAGAVVLLSGSYLVVRTRFRSGG
jgi:drug/metabolite transporter (DMT)-like permease